MKPIWFAVFTSQLAFALAVFDIDQIVRAIRKSKTGTWEITENSVNEIEIQQITVKPEKIEFNNTKVYIVLKQEWITTSKYQIYYLVPEHSSISIRFKAVEYVIELRNILMAEKNKDIKINHISFIREIHNQESRKFRDIFPQLRKNQLNSPRRLYRFSNVNGKVRFQQVPLQFSKLNTSDTFIFDYPSSIILFNIKNRNADTSITSAAERIAKFIFFENGSYETFDLDQCRNWVPRKANCYSEFISKLEGCPEPENVIQKMLENEVEEIPVCYVFVLEKVNEAFIYIRDFESYKRVEICLKYGEVLASENEYLVSIFHKARPDRPFIFLFKNFRSLILSPKIKWIGLMTFFDMKLDIKNGLP